MVQLNERPKRVFQGDKVRLWPLLERRLLSGEIDSFDPLHDGAQPRTRRLWKFLLLAVFAFLVLGDNLAAGYVDNII